MLATGSYFSTLGVSAARTAQATRIEPVVALRYE